MIAWLLIPALGYAAFRIFQAKGIIPETALKAGQVYGLNVFTAQGTPPAAVPALVLATGALLVPAGSLPTPVKQIGNQLQWLFYARAGKDTNLPVSGNGVRIPSAFAIPK